MNDAFDRACDKLAGEYGTSHVMPDYMLRDFLGYFLDEAAGEPVRAAVLAARAGDGQILLREDMKWCEPAASAGIIGAAVVRSLKQQAAEPGSATAVDGSANSAGKEPT